MSLLSLFAALLLEQFHPLSTRNYLFVWMNGYVDFFEKHFNAGEHKHGKIAWLIAMGAPLVLVAAIYWLLHALLPLLAWLFCALILYLTMGFRQFSHNFTKIHQALRDGQLTEARSLLSNWRGKACDELNAEEIARVAIEQALLASHRNVFGVMFCFIISMTLGLGPIGAILYRLTQFLNRRWGSDSATELGEFGAFARKANFWVEWLPLRLTTSTFAIVGDFEDTIYCWRNQAASWPDPESGIVLAGGAGALGVRLGQTILQDGLPEHRPELGIGDEADADFMQSAIGLVWRALVFWMILLLLLSLSNLVS
jgi:cobalamin biosynthesis protein CobD/CbiB